MLDNDTFATFRPHKLGFQPCGAGLARKSAPFPGDNRRIEQSRYSLFQTRYRCGGNLFAGGDAVKEKYDVNAANFLQTDYTCTARLAN